MRPFALFSVCLLSFAACMPEAEAAMVESPTPVMTPTPEPAPEPNCDVASDPLTATAVTKFAHQEQSNLCWAAVIVMLERAAGMPEHKQCELASLELSRNISTGAISAADVNGGAPITDQFCCDKTQARTAACNAPASVYSVFNSLLAGDADYDVGLSPQERFDTEISNGRPLALSYWNEELGGHIVLVNEYKPLIENVRFYHMMDPAFGEFDLRYDKLTTGYQVQSKQWDLHHTLFGFANPEKVCQ